VAGDAEWRELLKYEKGEIEKLDLSLHTGTRIVSIDRDERLVTDDRGKVHPYDRLIVATGSRAFVPPGAPVGEPGVFTMRNRRDAESLRASIGAGGHVLIVGGGLLGLELAASLVGSGIHVTIVEAGGRLMERQLDPLAGELLMDFVEEGGINVHLNDQVQGVRSEGEGERRNLWVLLRSGRYIRADAVVYAVGTRPNSELLSDAGVACGRGVLVNDRLQCSDPAIYAIGEIAEHRGRLHGITLAAEEQALVAARHLAGDPLASYEGSVGVNILKFSGMTLCSIGLPMIPPGEKGYEEIVLLDRADRYYKKCIVRDDRLVGAILMGGREEFQEFRDLIAQGTELSERRRELLRGGPAREPVEGRVVCSCVQVGEGNLVRRIVAGCHDLEGLMADSGAGTGCGSCRGELRRLLEIQIPAEVA
jgi:ferredoxin-nitrate reductase